MIKTTLFAALLSCAACSSIIEGTAQRIAVNTMPAGANCTLVSNNQPIGVIVNTPGAVLIEKSKYDIVIHCKKDGYQPAEYINYSGAAAVTFVNIVDGGIGWAVDSASGADNKYESSVDIALVPAPRRYEPPPPRRPTHYRTSRAEQFRQAPAKPTKIADLIRNDQRLAAGASR